MGELRHLLFDFFGTLVAYRNSWTEQGFERSHAVALASGAELDYAAFLQRVSNTFEEFEARALHSLAEYSMDAFCAEFLGRVLRRAPDSDAVARFRDAYLSEWNKGVTYIPGVQELLAELAERFVLVLVSNANDADFVRSHLRALGIADRFAHVVISVEHGRRKPSPCIFQEALARVGGTAESGVYVGDSFAADYRGAAGAGLRCLLIDPERRHSVPEADRLTHILELRSRL
jgi:putative hydrolase of the HAD superfamily